jgi:hypothetical protein
MATDKSINIRQAEATEKLAVALADIQQILKELKTDLDELKSLAKVPQGSETKFEAANRQIRSRP